MSAGPQTLADAMIAAITAEVSLPKATRRSVGVLYGLCIATLPPDSEQWKAINGAISLRFGNGALEPVKEVGWRLYEATRAALAGAAP